MQPPCDLLVPRSENTPDPARHPQSFVRDRLHAALVRPRNVEDAAMRRRLATVDGLHELVERQIRNDVRRSTQMLPVRASAATDDVQCPPRARAHWIGPTCILGVLLLIFVVTLVRIVFRQ